jgi:hypothetical protein
MKNLWLKFIILWFNKNKLIKIWTTAPLLNFIKKNVWFPPQLCLRIYSNVSWEQNTSNMKNIFFALNRLKKLNYGLKDFLWLNFLFRHWTKGWNNFKVKNFLISFSFTFFFSASFSSDKVWTYLCHLLNDEEVKIFFLAFFDGWLQTCFRNRWRSKRLIDAKSVTKDF